MQTQDKKITETSEAYLYKGVAIPKLKRGQLNIYNSSQIKAVGTETFLELICEKEPIQPPDLGFSDEEWNEMEELLKED